MNSINVFLETGKKKVFAGAVDWPGWCRSGRDEESAVQALIDYGSRYAQVLGGQGIDFQAPTDPADLVVIERHDGNSTTDFGAPAIMLKADQEPLDQTDFERSERLLGACWEAFDRAVERAAGFELRKGPRGGGRDLDKIIEHVIEADRAYLARLAWKHKRETGIDLTEELGRTRQAILDALAVAAAGDLPEKGPRGGVIWPVPFFVRRVAWHVLDHAWEIEDRVEN
jgi:hypothetical protein